MLNSLGSGGFRFRDWFVFALVGWMVCERLSFGLSGWSGLVWLDVFSSGGGVVTRSVLSVRSFVSCCILYAACCTRSVLSLRF